MSEPMTVRDIPLAISVVAALSIALSIAYELGYLLAIDYNLPSLFSVQDAVVGALHFVPFGLFFVVCAFVVLGMLVSIHGISEVKQSKWLDRVTTLLPLLGAAFLLLATPFRFYGVLMIVSALVDFAIGVINRRFPSQRQPLLAIVGICWSLSAAFCIGGERASGQLASKVYDYEISTEAGPPISADLLKSGSDYFLVRATDSTVTVIPSSQVKKIEVKKIEAARPWLPLNIFPPTLH